MHLLTNAEIEESLPLIPDIISLSLKYKMSDIIFVRLGLTVTFARFPYVQNVWAKILSERALLTFSIESATDPVHSEHFDW